MSNKNIFEHFYSKLFNDTSEDSLNKSFRFLTNEMDKISNEFRLFLVYLKQIDNAKLWHSIIKETNDFAGDIRTLLRHLEDFNLKN